jgi:hypothetical protein
MLIIAEKVRALSHLDMGKVCNLIIINGPITVNVWDRKLLIKKEKDNSS